MLKMREIETMRSAPKKDSFLSKNSDFDHGDHIVLDQYRYGASIGSLHRVAGYLLSGDCGECGL